MECERKTSHSVYDITYHLVWITKDHKTVFRSEIARRLRELVRGIGKEMDIEILTGLVSLDHGHVFVSMPPQGSVSQVGEAKDQMKEFR